MKAFKKGDTVYRANNWNGLNVATVQEFTVVSWGDKQANLREVSGMMLQEMIYLDRGHNNHMFATREEATICAQDIMDSNVTRRLQSYKQELARYTKFNQLHTPNAVLTASQLKDYEENGCYVLDYEEAVRRNRL